MRAMRIGLGLAFVLSTAVAAIAQLPDSPRGRAGNAFLKAFNSGGAAERRAFVEQWVAEGERAAALERLEAAYAATGGLRMRGAEAHPNAVTIMGRATNGGEPWRVEIAIAGQPPHEIVGLELLAGTGPPPGGVDLPSLAPDAPDNEVAAALDAYLSRLAETDQFSGVALVERGGQVIFEGAYGEASKRFGVPNRFDTRFNLGSINKLFTLMCTARLVSEGRLSWSDTIAKWLPDYPGPGVDEITVEQLASMRSGLGDIFTEEFSRTSKTAFREPSDFFTLFSDAALQFEPGTSRAYSNAGFMVLGAIVAAAADESYFDYVRRVVYEPAGMTATDAYEADLPVENVAEGYSRQLSGDGVDHEPDPGTAWRSNVFHNLYKGSPAGGGYSTARDLLGFARALREERLLGLEEVREAFAIGFGREGDEQRDLNLGVGGGGPGVNAMLEMSGDSTIVVLANYDPPAAQTAARGIRDMLAGQ